MPQSVITAPRALSLVVALYCWQPNMNSEPGLHRHGSAERHVFGVNCSTSRYGRAYWQSAVAFLRLPGRHQKVGAKTTLMGS
jgi:hypothetical protein